MQRPKDFSSLDPVKFDLAYSAFRKKINTFARNALRRLPGMDVEDIEQELCYVLMRCVRDYDPDMGASFNTMAQGSFQRKIIDLQRKLNTAGRKAELVYLDADEVREAVEGLIPGLASAEDEAMAPHSLSDDELEWVRANLTMRQIELLGLMDVA